MAQDGGNVDNNTQAWRKVLVTGGSGFTGINLIRYLLDKGVSVRSLDFAEFTYTDCKDRICLLYTSDAADEYQRV